MIVSEVFWPEDFLVNDLAYEWHNQGHHVEVISQYPSYPQGIVYDNYRNMGEMEERWDGIKIHRFPVVEGYREKKRRKFCNYIKFVCQGKKIANRIAKDVDVIFVSQTGPLTVALPALAAGKKYNIPVAIWTQDIWPDVVWTYGIPRLKPIAWWLDRFIRKIYRGCDRIFVSSKNFEDTIFRYSKKNIIYAPNWLRPIEEAESDVRLDIEKFNFTFTGNISRYQNLTNVVLGFGKAQLENCVLNIVGNGSFLDQVKVVVAHHGIKNVVFHDRKPYNTINDILRQSDVLLLPLIPDEGVCKTEPFKIQSYLHAGKPIMGVLIGSGKDIIEVNELGLVARPDDVDDIASVFKEMIAFSQENSNKVSIRASELMKTRFCREKIVNTLTTNLPNHKDDR